MKTPIGIRIIVENHGERQIHKFDRILKAGYPVIVIEEDEEGNELNRYELSPPDGVNST